MTVEEIKVKFSVELNNLKKNLESARGQLTKVSDAFEDLDGDIERAKKSMDKNAEKIAKALESEKKKYQSTTNAAQKYAQNIQELGVKYDLVKTKAEKYASEISNQESKINKMQTAYEKMSNVMSSMQIKGSINEELQNLESILEKNKTKALQLETEMNKLSNSNYEIGEVDGEFMNYEQMAEALNKVDAESEQAYNRLNQLKAGINGVDEGLLDLGNKQGLEKLNNQITQQQVKLTSLKAIYQQTQNSLNALSNRQEQATAKLGQSKQSIASAKERIMQLRQSLGSLSSTTKGAFMANVSAKLKAVGNAASSLIHRFQNGVSSIFKFGKGLLNVGKQAVGIIGRFTLLGKAVGSVRNKISGFASNASQNLRMIKSIVMSMLLMKLFTIFSEGMGNLAKQSSGFNSSISKIYSSLSYLKNSIVSAFSPLVSYVQPMVSSVINTIADAFNKLGELIAGLTGQKTYTKAVYQQKDYAASLDDTADSTSNANKEAEKYKKTIAGFDEITKLDDNTSSSNSGSGSSGSGNSDAGAWTTSKVDVSSSLLNSIKDGDWTSVGEALGNKINQALGSIDWGKIQKKVNNIAKNIADFLNGAIKATDWNLVGTTIGQAVNTILGFFNTFATTYDWSKFGKAIAQSLNGAMKAIDWKLAGETLGNSLTGVFDTLYEVVTTFDWKKLGSSLADAVNGCVDKLDLAKGTAAIGEAVKGLCNAIAEFFEKTDWKAIGKKVVKAVTSVDWLGIVIAALKAVFAIAGAFVELIEGIIDGIIDGVRTTDWVKVAKEIWKAIVTAFKGIGGLILEVSLYLGTKAKDLWDGIKSGWNAIKDKALEAEAKLKSKIETTRDQIRAKWKEVSADWSDKVNNLRLSAKQKASDIREWWNNKTAGWRDKANSLKLNAKQKVNDINKWWKDRAAKWKNKEVSFKIKAENKIEEIKKDFKKAINTVIAWLNKYIIDNINKISIKVPAIKVAGKTLFGGKTFGFDVNHIKSFKLGGFPDGEDGLFYANHNEMVGTFSNGKTAVANNDQIVSGISAGVYSAVTAAMGKSGSGNSPILNVYVGGKEITDYVVKDVNNRTIATGRCPILT